MGAIREVATSTTTPSQESWGAAQPRSLQVGAWLECVVAIAIESMATQPQACRLPNRRCSILFHLLVPGGASSAGRVRRPAPFAFTARSRIADVLIGSQQASLPMGWGGTLLLVPDPLITQVIPSLPPNGTTLSDDIADDSALCGLELHLQKLMRDAGAAREYRRARDWCSSLGTDSNGSVHLDVVQGQRIGVPFAASSA